MERKLCGMQNISPKHFHTDTRTSDWIKRWESDYSLKLEQQWHLDAIEIPRERIRSSVGTALCISFHKKIVTLGRRNRRQIRLGHIMVLAGFRLYSTNSSVEKSPLWDKVQISLSPIFSSKRICRNVCLCTGGTRSIIMVLLLIASATVSLRPHGNGPYKTSAHQLSPQKLIFSVANNPAC